MVDERDIREVLATIPDPEMPLSIVDLGIVEAVRVTPLAGDAVRAEVDIVPTFIGCPALDMIRDEIRAKVGVLDGVVKVAVRFLNDPPWSTDRITEAGRAALREFGVSTPGQKTAESPQPVVLTTPIDGERDATTPLSDGRGSDDAAVRCPYCDSPDTTLESRFGPTRCKMIYYCHACRNSFEHMKRV